MPWHGCASFGLRAYSHLTRSLFRWVMQEMHGKAALQETPTVHGPQWTLPRLKSAKFSRMLCSSLDQQLQGQTVITASQAKVGPGSMSCQRLQKIRTR